MNLFIKGRGIGFTVYVKTGYWPKEDSFTEKCELPITDPEDSYCEPEFFRNSSRPIFYRDFADSMLNEATFLEFQKKLSKPKSKRCDAAYFKILHPFTCVFTPDVLGTYVRISLKMCPA